MRKKAEDDKYIIAETCGVKLILNMYPIIWNAVFCLFYYLIYDKQYSSDHFKF
jgi:hypothetical protein